MPDATQVISAIDSRVSQVKTSSLDISFNELLDMFKSGELVIAPEYQRLFRWSELKQSQFIESIALEMPIPPIYVIELEDGRYELIDGLQRISTYLHFRGEHPDIPEALALKHCDIVPELDGYTFASLPQALQYKLRRPFVRVEVIRRGSDIRYRYHMFKRLNTGGEDLSDQEVRNCTIRLLSSRFNDFIIDCARYAPYKICLDRVSEEKKKQMYFEECVLRFFALLNYRDRYDHLVGEFLTEYMEAVSDPTVSTQFDYATGRDAFTRTFDILNAALGDQSFSTVNRSSGTIMNNFSVNHFEALSLGVATHAARLDPANEGQMGRLRSSLMDLKSSQAFTQVTAGGGLNYAKPLNDRIALATNIIGEILDA
jgi:hypothetical protein